MIALFLLLLSAPAASQELPGAEAAIRSQIAGYLDAWNRGDADALASYVDLEGDRISARATVISGRDGIREHYRKVFAEAPPEGPQRRFSYSDVVVRIVSSDAAVVDAAYEVAGVGPEPSLIVRGRNAVFMVKRDGVWLRAAHRNFVPTSAECIRLCSAL